MTDDITFTYDTDPGDDITFEIPVPSGGAVDSVNGQTGTVVLDADDVGAAADDDARLSDARTPTAHKASHATGGTDALTAADIGALPSTSTPWRDRIELPWWQYPNTHPALTFAAGNVVAGGYYITPSTNDVTLTYTRLALRAGTWELVVFFRSGNADGIASFALGGTGIGTVDFYAGAAASNNRAALSGVTVSADGFYDLVVTNATKNGSSSNYRLNVHAIALRRTGS